jgi:hypothetical protein
MRWVSAQLRLTVGWGPNCAAAAIMQHRTGVQRFASASVAHRICDPGRSRIAVDSVGASGWVDEIGTT